jgi:hypothetical protein
VKPPKTWNVKRNGKNKAEIEKSHFFVDVRQLEFGDLCELDELYFTGEKIEMKNILRPSSFIGGWKRRDETLVPLKSSRALRLLLPSNWKQKQMIKTSGEQEAIYCAQTTKLNFHPFNFFSFLVKKKKKKSSPLLLCTPRGHR